MESIRTRPAHCFSSVKQPQCDSSTTSGSRSKTSKFKKVSQQTLVNRNQEWREHEHQYSFTCTSLRTFSYSINRTLGFWVALRQRQGGRRGHRRPKNDQFLPDWHGVWTRGVKSFVVEIFSFVSLCLPLFSTLSLASRDSTWRACVSPRRDGNITLGVVRRSSFLRINYIKSFSLVVVFKTYKECFWKKKNEFDGMAEAGIPPPPPSSHSSLQQQQRSSGSTLSSQPAATTTISTIAVQSGATRIVVALLQVKIPLLSLAYTNQQQLLIISALTSSWMFIAFIPVDNFQGVVHLIIKWMASKVISLQVERADFFLSSA